MDLLTALAERLHRAAAEEAPDRITIGDVYQRLIPYRTVRGEMGVLEFAAYEHALLRLLAGEGRHAEIREEAAREEIQRELASVNPILGIYRDYESATVVLDGAAVPARPPEAAEGVRAGAHSPGVDHLPPLESAGPAAPSRPLPSDSPIERGREPMSSEIAGETRSCANCEQPLPQEAGLRFCPYCGDAQDPVPCARCGSAVKAEWNFCIRCGAAALP